MKKNLKCLVKIVMLLDVGTCRREKVIGIFSIPSEKYPELRKAWITLLKRFQEPDAQFRELIAKNRVCTCEKHFHPNEYETCKFCFFLLKR